MEEEGRPIEQNDWTSQFILSAILRVLQYPCTGQEPLQMVQVCRVTTGRAEPLSRTNNRGPGSDLLPAVICRPPGLP